MSNSTVPTSQCDTTKRLALQILSIPPLRLDAAAGRF
jgi:hypothetical protein